MIDSSRDHQSWRLGPKLHRRNGWLMFTESGTSFNLLTAACAHRADRSLAHRISVCTEGTNVPMYFFDRSPAGFDQIQKSLFKSALLRQSDTDVSNVLYASSPKQSSHNNRGVLVMGVSKYNHLRPDLVTRRVGER